MNTAARITLRTTAAIVAAVVTAGLLISAAPRPAEAVLPTYSRTAVVLEADQAARDESSTLSANITAASALLTQSNGLVADDATRVQLTASIASATASVSATNSALLTAQFEYTVTKPVTSGLDAATSQLTASVTAVQASEQQLAAQKAAAAAAAARAAAARNAAASATVNGVHYVNVWTAGEQAAIDACRGAADLTAWYYVAVIAEHWRCGGSSFPTTPGATVVLTGLRAGTYKVIGRVATLNAYTQTTGDIPRGYDLLFQTCYLDDSHHTEFIALQKIS